MLIAYKGISQNKSLTNISQISIIDTALANNIHYVIKKETDTNVSGSLFKEGYGYICVYLQKFSYGDTIREYRITPRLSDIKERAPDKFYPDYYTYLDKRLVLIFVNAINEFADRKFSKKSKNNVRKLIDNTLEPTKTVVFHNVNGKKRVKDKHFRPDYFKSDQGITLIILKNHRTVRIPDMIF